MKLIDISARPYALHGRRNYSVESEGQMQSDAYAITDFCQRHGISRATFYNLLKRGEAPNVMKVGSRTLISAEAAAAWRQRMESQTPTKQAA